MSQTNLINVTVHFNGNNHHLFINANDSIIQFSSLVSQSFHIPLSEYEILHKNKAISVYSSTKMIECIHPNNNAPALFVLKRNSKDTIIIIISSQSSIGYQYKNVHCNYNGGLSILD